jgi:hypothetical protein
VGINKDNSPLTHSLCVFHPELLGEQHEGVHWPLTPGGVRTSWLTAWHTFDWLLVLRMGGAGALGICCFVFFLKGMLWVNPLTFDPAVLTLIM